MPSTDVTGVAIFDNGASFAPGFPQRYSTALAEARDAINGIEAGAAYLNPDSLRVYQDIYRLRIELELEAAAVLWRAAEATSALADANEALRRSMSGGAFAVSAELVEAHRAPIPPVWRPLAHRRFVSTRGLPETVATPVPQPHYTSEPVSPSDSDPASPSEGELLLRRLEAHYRESGSSGRLARWLRRFLPGGRRRRARSLQYTAAPYASEDRGDRQGVALHDV